MFELPFVGKEVCMKKMILSLFCVMMLSSVLPSTLVRAQLPGDDPGDNDEGPFIEEPMGEEEEEEGTIKKKEPEKPAVKKPPQAKPQPETEDIEDIEDTEEMEESL